MDRNRPMADGRDIFESELQDAIRRPRKFVFDWFDELVSDYNSQTDHVGAQDEASEAREVGDGVRPETYINFEFEGERIPIGTCDLNETDGGEIHMRIKFF